MALYGMSGQTCTSEYVCRNWHTRSAVLAGRSLRNASHFKVTSSVVAGHEAGAAQHHHQMCEHDTVAQQALTTLKSMQLSFLQHTCC